MTKRKKKLLIIQLSLLILGILLFYISYYLPSSKDTKLSMDKDLNSKDLEGKKQTEEGKNLFENVEYKGIDLNGNRYIISSDEASFDVEKPEIIFMKIVQASFYFKDDTVLNVYATNGIYNNLTNDMEFSDNVKVDYLKNKLSSDNLSYLNSKNLLKIFGNIQGQGPKGEIIADQLQFDIKKQTLDISMFDNYKINFILKK